MVADLIKDALGLSQSERDYLEANYDQSEWQDVMATAEALDMGIEDVTDDDVEEFLSTGGSEQIETSMGNAVFKWDNISKTYILYLALEPGQNSKCDGKQVYKNITRDMIQDMKSADSFGSFYNDKLRGNTSIEGCGCADNCCDDADFAEMPSKFRPLF